MQLYHPSSKGILYYLPIIQKLEDILHCPQSESILHNSPIRMHLFHPLIKRHPLLFTNYSQSEDILQCLSMRKHPRLFSNQNAPVSSINQNTSYIHQLFINQKTSYIVLQSESILYYSSIRMDLYHPLIKMHPIFTNISSIKIHPTLSFN